MIEAMKQALKALEQVKPLYDKHHAIAALRQAIEQAEKQEPAIDKSAAIRIATALGWESKREWVGLTDEEIQAVLDNPEPFYDTMFWFARTIERKLKEKNT